MRNIKFKFMSFLTALFILLGTNLSTLVPIANVSTSNYAYAYTTNTTKNYTVYITNTGEKYHAKGCRYLSKSCISIKKSSAVSQGYTACKVCRP